MAKWQHPLHRVRKRCRHSSITQSFSTSVETYRGGARLLFFQRSPRRQAVEASHHDTQYNNSPLLTPYHLKGTCAIFSRQFRYLSPCLGAALATSPFLGNLMRLGQRMPEVEVVDGYYKDFDSSQGKTSDEDPSHSLDYLLSTQLSQSSFLANNLFFQMIRESPIHLVRNKSLPASYLSPALIGSLLGHSVCHKTDTTEKSIRAALKRDFGIRSNYIHHDQWTGISVGRWMDLIVLDAGDDDANGNASSLHQTLVPALWLIALWGLSSSRNCLLDYYKGLEQTGGVNLDSRQLDYDDIFVEADFDPSNLQEAMDRLVHYYSRPCTHDDSLKDDYDSDLAARSLELVCANIALQQQPSSSSASVPVLPNGYYTFDGGEIKADCVEVAIREIFYLLLWDESSSSLDLSRLPNMACPSLIQLLQAESEYHRSTSRDYTIDFGQAWFDLLSNRSECTYLSKSPNGKPYELAPTLEGISMTLWSLLAGGDLNKRQWRSLQDFADFWSRHHPNRLFVQQDVLRHKQSNGGIIKHETALLQLHGSYRAIELRLRCDWDEACGMAAVTRLVEQHPQQHLDPEQVQKLYELLSTYGSTSGSSPDIQARHDPSLAVLCLALPSQSQHPGILPILATPYGPDRRALRVADDEDLILHQGRQDLRRSQHVMKEQIVHACHLCEPFPKLGTQLLFWILQESPVVVERSEPLQLQDDAIYSEIEKAIQQLPVSVYDNESLLEAIEWNWACRETTVGLSIKQRLGKASWVDSVKRMWLGYT